MARILSVLYLSMSNIPFGRVEVNQKCVLFDIKYSDHAVVNRQIWTTSCFDLVVWIVVRG